MSDLRRYEFADPDLPWPADNIPYALFVRAADHDAIAPYVQHLISCARDVKGNGCSCGLDKVQS